MTHENAGQSGAQDLKLYSVAFSTWNGSFSGLDHHNVLAVGSGAEDAIRRTGFGLVRHREAIKVL